MISAPNRIAEAIAHLEKGEQVDWHALANLQALDLVQIGQQFMEDAILFNEQQTEVVRKAIEG